MRRASKIGTLAIFAALTSCAPTTATAPASVAPSAEALSALESEYLQDTTNVETKIRLGAAYTTAGRPEDAFPLLWDAALADPTSAPALFYLATTHEALGQYAQARIAYERFLAMGPPPNVAGPVRDRLPLLRRRELETHVARSLALEDSLVAHPAPHSVGVFPFVYQGSDPSFEPLGRAFAHMLTTDLGQVDRITVLERVETQALLDELRMGELHYVDASTAARSGRILGAGRIVQGRIEGTSDDVAVEAAVVPVEDPPEARTVSESDAAESLFELEARVAFGILESLGVELAPAERDRIARAPTTSSAALLAFGRGLIAMDAGDYSTAAAEMRAAADLDPSFAEAQQMADQAEAMEAASATTPVQVAATGYGPLVEEPVLPTQTAIPQGDWRDRYVEVEQIIPDVTTRDAVSEVTGFEGFGSGAPVLEVIIRRPPGNP